MHSSSRRQQLMFVCLLFSVYVGVCILSPSYATEESQLPSVVHVVTDCLELGDNLRLKSCQYFVSLK
jgi:hypothetical protein